MSTDRNSLLLKAVEDSTSKTGKHGHAKCHFVAIDIFTRKKLKDVVPCSHNSDAISLIILSSVSLLTKNGNTKDDLRLPTDDTLLAQVGLWRRFLSTVASTIEIALLQCLHIGQLFNYCSRAMAMVVVTVAIEVPEKSRRKSATDYTVKQALAVWGDSSSESEKDENPEDVCMLAVEDKNVTFDSLFALMANTKDEEENKIRSIANGELSYLSVQSEDADLWHRRMGYVSFSLLKKLISKNLVRGMPKLKFPDNKVCDAFVYGKHTWSSFKMKWKVSTSRPHKLLQMDMCGPVKVQSRGGKKYVFVIVDDYFRFTWTMFLRTKDETYEIGKLVNLYDDEDSDIKELIPIQMDDIAKDDGQRLNHTDGNDKGYGDLRY
ncbi:Eukaryotic translation initiation factor 5A-4 [Capsicum annuum]|nr:Eukaryotic translation initiation factor 5A-4 [Capsicum annuum]